MSEAVRTLLAPITKDEATKEDSLEARLAKFPTDSEWKDMEVRIVRACENLAAEAAAIGTEQTMYVRNVDRNDAYMTVFVSPQPDSSAGGFWVYDVEQILEPDDSPAVVEPTEEPTPDLIARKNQEITNLGAEVVRLRAAVEERIRLHRAAEDAYRRFEQQVRDKAIEVAEAQGWCDAGLNEVLEDLGLDPKKGKLFEITVTTTKKFTARIQNGKDSDVSESFIRDSVQNARDICLDGDWDVESEGDADIEIQYEEAN